MEINKDNLKYYYEYIDKICPFDAILFRDDDYISDIIAVLEKYKLNMNTFTHIGMVVTSDILPECTIDNKIFKLKPKKLYVFESTFGYTMPGIIENVKDISGKGKFGVQLRELEKVIPNYIDSQKTKVAWCKLRNNPYRQKDESNEELLKRRQELQLQFISFFNNYYNRTYEINPLGLLSSMFTSLRPLRDQRDKLYTKIWKKMNKNAKDVPIVNFQFCSELIANVWNMIGVINVDARNYIPMDVFGDSIDDVDRVVDDPIYFKDWGKDAIQYIL